MSTAAAVLNLLEKAKERPDGSVCALALIKRTNQAVFDDRPQQRGYRHPSGHAGKLRAVIRSGARGSDHKERKFSCWGKEMTGFGASRPLRRIPAIVSFLNPQPETLCGAYFRIPQGR